MRKAWLFVLLVGCADASKTIEKLADRACACKDAACAEKAVDDLVQFGKDNPSMTGDQQKAVEQIQRLDKCALSAGMDSGKLMAKMKVLQDIH
ncbi:MAG TPA: hypothetical protein VGG74_23680 [Kofleriaceae bacterium]|jgi:uncharacterized protein YoaH (UPF0181 family)